MVSDHIGEKVTTTVFTFTKNLVEISFKICCAIWGEW